MKLGSLRTCSIKRISTAVALVYIAFMWHWTLRGTWDMLSHFPQSVREFQQRHRLTPDGIYGKRTERRVLAELRRRARRTGGAAGVVVENGRGRGHEPGG